MNLDKLILFDKKDKQIFLKDANIDTGIVNLANALNNIDYLVTMNSCQGALYEEEADNHCPKTYIDFYVLNHNYTLANNLMSSLTSKFGSMLNCTIQFEPDFDTFTDENEEEYVEDNGLIKLRYSIEFCDVNEWIKDSKITMQEVVDFINNYSLNLKG